MPGRMPGRKPGRRRVTALVGTGTVGRVVGRLLRRVAGGLPGGVAGAPPARDPLVRHDLYGIDMDRLQRVSSNQAPPLVGRDPVAGDPMLTGPLHAFAPEAATEVLGGLRDLAADAGSAAAAEHGRLANAHPPVLAAHDRYGNRVDEVVFHPSWHWLLERGVRHGLHAAPWAADHTAPHLRRAPGFVAWSPGRAGPRLPDLDDVRRRPGAAHRRRAGQGVGAAADRHRLRAGLRLARRQARRARRHGDDGEAGRLRRPGQHHRRAVAADRRRRRLPLGRPQVVLLGTHVRRVPRARPGRGRADLLRRAAGAARRQPQPIRAAAAEGQARQPVQRLGGDRARRHPRLAARRRGPRRAHHPGDGRRHPARLRARLRRADAAGRRRGGLARAAPLGLRRPAGRPASDAAGARRPRGRGRGGAPGWGCGWPPRSTAPPTRTSRHCAGSRCRSRSSGCASAPPATSPRRWNALVATASSRSPVSRCCSASRR